MANSSAVSANLVSNLSITETFSPFANPALDSILLDGLNENVTLDGSSSPAATKASIFTVTGSGSIDLTQIPGLEADETIDGTGLKVQFIKFQAGAANANPITVTKAVSNGYGFDAAGSSWTMVFDAGQSDAKNLNATAPTIGGSAKAITITATGSQTIKVAIVVG